MLLSILYQDATLIAVNKPTGLLVHRSPMATDTVNCLACLRDQIGQRVFPVHRLDRATSGALLFARSSESARQVCELFASRVVVKSYLAIARGYTSEFVDIDYPLREEPSSPAMPARSTLCRLNTTELPIAVGRYDTARYSLLHVTTSTGRRHQIRRHLAHIRHPIIGDSVHGDGRHNQFFREQFSSNRLLLHAVSIGFKHPVTGKEITICAPLSTELEHLIQQLGWTISYDCFMGT